MALLCGQLTASGCGDRAATALKVRALVFRSLAKRQKNIWLLMLGLPSSQSHIVAVHTGVQGVTSFSEEFRSHDARHICHWAVSLAVPVISSAVLVTCFIVCWQSGMLADSKLFAPADAPCAHVCTSQHTSELNLCRRVCRTATPLPAWLNNKFRRLTVWRPQGPRSRSCRRRLPATADPMRQSSCSGAAT